MQRQKYPSKFRNPQQNNKLISILTCKPRLDGIEKKTSAQIQLMQQKEKEENEGIRGKQNLRLHRRRHEGFRFGRSRFMGIWVREVEGFCLGKPRFLLCLRSSSSLLSLPLSSFSLVLCLYLLLRSSSSSLLHSSCQVKSSLTDSKCQFSKQFRNEAN